MPDQRLPMLLDSLRMLAAPADEQLGYLRSLGSYPSTDELALEFDAIYGVSPALVSEGLLPESVQPLLDKIDTLLDTMSSDLTLWTPQALWQSPAWAEIRVLAADALREIETWGGPNKATAPAPATTSNSLRDLWSPAIPTLNGWFFAAYVMQALLLPAFTMLLPGWYPMWLRLPFQILGGILAVGVLIAAVWWLRTRKESPERAELLLMLAILHSTLIGWLGLGFEIWMWGALHQMVSGNLWLATLFAAGVTMAGIAFGLMRSPWLNKAYRNTFNYPGKQFDARPRTTIAMWIVVILLGTILPYRLNIVLAGLSIGPLAIALAITGLLKVRDHLHSTEAL